MIKNNMQNKILSVVKGLSQARYQIFVDNLGEVNKIKCIDCKSCIEYVNVKDGLLLFICSDCSKSC